MSTNVEFLIIQKTAKSLLIVITTRRKSKQSTNQYFTVKTGFIFAKTIIKTRFL